MRIFTKEELAEILERHLHWLREDCDGWEDMRANLRSADLSSADLSYADLSYANLRSADLSYADLSYANLRSANLSYADLSYADLRSADLSYADLRSADLSYANLSSADLSYANLRSANLSYANLSSADLRYANLSSANLSSANLRSANLSSAKDVYYPIACPDTGSFIGWKKDGTGKYIIKLLIPEDAKRLSATGRKCRCDKAQVLAIENIDGTPSEKTETYSQNDNHFIYRVGETVTPEKPFCEDRWEECSSGIHFFINRQEAVNY